MLIYFGRSSDFGFAVSLPRVKSKVGQLDALCRRRLQRFRFLTPICDTLAPGIVRSILERLLRVHMVLCCGRLVKETREYGK